MRAYTFSIGSELILGHLTDTNATFLAQELANLGIELLHVVQVGDDRERISRMLALAAREADLIVCTGGVGPTEDDLTREAIADLVGETPEVDAGALSLIASFFASRGLEMPERNKKQAWLIPSAEILPNPVGTAPGWLVRHDRTTIIAMPGVPREMTRMWREQAVPRIMTRLPRRAISSITFKTIGIGESLAEERLGDLVTRGNPIVATYAKDDGVHIRVTAVAPDATEADRLRNETAQAVKERVGTFIYGTDHQTLPNALAELLIEAKSTLTVIDEGGGGRFASLLASSPLAESVLAMGIVRPRTSHHATDLAAEAASQSPVGLGLTVDAVEAPQGLYSATIEVAVAGQRTAQATFPFRSTLEEIQRRSGLFAAETLRRALLP